MSKTVFVMEIEMGNDAMRTRRDLVHALGTVRERLIQNPGACDGVIRDENGNRVGTWEIAAR